MSAQNDWRHGTPFTPEEDQTLRTMLAAGRSRTEISAALKRSKSSLGSRICKLQLSDAKKVVYTFRRDLGAVRTSELGKPLTLGPGDARYVAACKAAGGFHYTTRLADGRLVTVTP